MCRMLEYEVPQTRLETETRWYLANSLHDKAQKFGAKNLFFPNEIVLFTREAGLLGDLTIIADSRPDRFFVAICGGRYLPSPNKLYGGGYYLSQAEGQNLSPCLMQASPTRLPIAGRAILWDKEVSLDKAIAVLKEINDAPPDKMESLPKYFIPSKYLVSKEFENGDDFFVLPRGADWREALALFNRPELLFPRQDPYTGEITGLILECEQEHFKERERVMNEVMLAWGLTRESLTGLSSSRRSRIFRKITAEIDRRMWQSAIIAKL